MTDRHQLKPYTLRIPDDLRAELEAAATAGSRTLHAEIISRLQSTFAPQSGAGTMDAYAVKRMVDEMIQKRIGPDGYVKPFRTAVMSISAKELDAALERHEAAKVKRAARPDLSQRPQGDVKVVVQYTVETEEGQSEEGQLPPTPATGDEPS